MNNDLYNELSTNFIEYAVAVNSDRAIPDATSGLKPVARRILWSMYEEGRTASKPHVKAARITGDVMGKYHPHGDSSIYGAMVRLSQPWVMRYPLIDWHGNNGNIAGDGPAAARYTEARLAKISEQGLLYGIKKKNVDFIPNYDETLEEPITLPSTFPNLLCNPNTGIGVAMACNWAPHNLNDVTKAIVDYLHGITPMLPGPDFPTGGLIINKDDIPKIYKTGHGTVKIRARYKIEKNKIIFYEIPYGQSIEGLLEEIGNACDKKEIEGISDAHDESNKKGIRIVIECNTNPEIVVKQIYSKTNFQTSFSFNQVALIDKTPTELNLLDCIRVYIRHNVECLIKEYNFDLDKAVKRLEIVNGLIKALEDIDNIIALIKKSENAGAAKESLIAKYEFTENQAKAILAMRLSSLAKLEAIELNKEKNELHEQIDNLNNFLNSKDQQFAEIERRLKEVCNKFGDERRTELTQINEPKESVKKEKAQVIPENVVVVISQNGYIKRVPRTSFKVQKRRGKGTKTLDKAILSTISTTTIDELMIFTSKGKMYKILVDKIPTGTNSDAGINVHNLFTMDSNEEIQAVTSINENCKENYITFFTKMGLVKKTKMSEYTSLKKSTGIQAIKIKDGDSLVNVSFMNEEDIILVTKQGISIKFNSKDINPIGRLTSGVKGIKLKDGDEVIIGLPIKNEQFIAVFRQDGLAKRISIKQFEEQGRGGRGVNLSKDIVAAAILVNPSDEILAIGKPNSICCLVSDLTEGSKMATGTEVIKNSRIEKVVKL